MKGNKGITLIALVITIIVLLILAGVSIAMLSGENSILAKSRKASIDTTLTTAKEQIAIKTNEIITNHYDNVYAQGNTEAKSIGQLVTEGLATYPGSTNDQIVYTAPTVSGNGTEAAGTGLKIEYKGDTSKYVDGAIDKNGKITWTDHYNN